MAAIEGATEDLRPDTGRTARTGGAILAAALLLPGLATLAQAEVAPDHSEVAVKFLSYQDGQPGLSRIRVNSPSISLLAPLGEKWSVSATGTHDDVSGASPRYHTAISGASHMKDERRAYDLKATRYFERAAVSLGVNGSTEHDYRAQGLTGQLRLASADSNTNWILGASVSNDRIDPVNFAVTNEHRHTTSLLAGVTQVLTADDVVQLNLGDTSGQGYFSDPYKTLDNRPRSRDQRTLTLAWNHYVAGAQAALRTSYRLYDDSWGVQAHMLGLEWQQAVSPAVSLTPSLRYTTQSAARFYYGPTYDSVFGAPFPPGYVFGSNAYMSPDQRLSAFGGLTAGLKADWRISPRLSVDLALDRYEQRSAWRLGGGGSPGLASFHATMLQTGLKWQF